MKKLVVIFATLFAINPMMGSEAFAKCRARVCIDGDLKILECSEDKQMTAMYAKQATDHPNENEFFVGLRQVKLRGEFSSATLCQGWETEAPETTAKDINEFVGSPLELVVSSKDETICKRRSIKIVAKTACCPNGQAKRECEKPLWIREIKDDVPR